MKEPLLPLPPLIEEIQGLSPDWLAEVEDFVEFIRQRDRTPTSGAAAAGAPTFAALWNNPEDDVYDAL